MSVTRTYSLSAFAVGAIVGGTSAYRYTMAKYRVPQNINLIVSIYHCLVISSDAPEATATSFWACCRTGETKYKKILIGMET
ncbi:uncharacterized protein P174DRAFT_234762 [Aspergillus novofumigatus IBT 16806]|uniref:Uncharacterized protein n=1 Tax=Aspergillus novofumigatus (strain IBT 16806) TaxID=1392255 RepID=A0A2I1C761_ASPN1|nr:uncharacterized protein P174DRAFT_234762 [Aspergillus novofumigatus IBT 16806]PKX93464.1 hypothetical protein P174DRAFT_234762 [Aspergillus novofumigatus IBT 16806]